LKRIFRYLKGTSTFRLSFGTGSNTVVGYCDADFAGNHETRKSTGAYGFTLNGGLISWSSKLQDIVATSTTESEYIAIFEAVKEAKWLRQFLSELDFIQEAPTEIFSDNQAAIALSKSKEFHRRTKHFDVRLHFVRHEQDDNQVRITYIPTNDQPIDMMTKSLNRPALNRCIKRIGLQGID